jgi:hydroxyethylthiazole kinase-like uncharacterized protein yjeF
MTPELIAQELLTPAECAVADRTAIEGGVPIATLMENAGRAVFRAIRARYSPCRTLVLCGPGNNGGDGFVAARLLDRAGWPVTVATLANTSPWRGCIVPFTATEAARADLVIDAVFGAGLTRDVSSSISDVLRAAKQIVAVDVPSGLDGATGQCRGEVAPAALTVTFFRKKPGHLLLPGRTLCGDVVLADIGLPASVLATVHPATFENTPSLWTLPVPGATSQKYSRGHATILGGAAMTGAARLAAAAARRAGAGMVTIAATGSADVYRNGAPGLIVDEADIQTQLRDHRRTVWLIGPGLGIPTATELLPTLLAAGRITVVDADALTACTGAPERLRGAAVLTPHAGEFARVFGPLGPDRLAAARAAAKTTNAVVLLKGADTIIAAPDGRAAINATAPPTLATAGAGDVLAGIITGLLAQGMPAWEAACAGAWLHGVAATLVGPGLIAEDIPDALPRAFPRQPG